MARGQRIHMEIVDWLVLALLGLVSGTVATIAGISGGLLFIAISACFGPHFTLAVTAPALIIGNTHRVFLLRSALIPRAVIPFAAAVALACLLLSSVALRLDATTLRWVAVSAPVLALVELWMSRPGGSAVAEGDESPVPNGQGQGQGQGQASGGAQRGLLAVGGLAVGGLLATGAGASVVAASLLRRSGLRRDAFVVALTAGALAGHGARCVAYGLTGSLDASVLIAASGLAAGVVAGNLSGHALAERCGERGRDRMLAVVVGLSLVLAVGQLVLDRPSTQPADSPTTDIGSSSPPGGETGSGHRLDPSISKWGAVPSQGAEKAGLRSGRMPILAATEVG